MGKLLIARNNMHVLQTVLAIDPKEMSLATFSRLIKELSEDPEVVDDFIRPGQLD